ncbi:MAG: glycoside hydrolase [Lewinellaceae bacterium]|nr:glycoside hydrolase [Lewinellaceae bacterium]
MQNKDQLLDKAHEILQLNLRAGFTVPTARLYPFQWNWDSGFVSMGWGHFNVAQAIRELETLFSGQWANGMLPHILFHSETETTYFPNHPFWESYRNPGAPQKPKSSGITQPPVHGFVLERLLAQHPQNTTLETFARAIWPKILHLHRFLYTHRDPEQEGLVFIYHPWESGRDNSPLWDAALRRIHLQPGMIPEYERQDNKIADPSERPTQADYDRYVYLLELGKKHAYEGPGIAAESPFLVQDTLFNALLIRSNESLMALGKRFGFDVRELERWQAKSIGHFREKLWNSALNMFVPFDLVQQEQIALREIGGFTALYAGIPDKRQADGMHQVLQSWQQRDFLLCPSFDPDAEAFDSRRYWRGPIWPQMNWLLYQGLVRYGFQETADIVRSDFLHLVDRLGFHEYFEPQKEIAATQTQGYGGGNFSWTAAAVADLLLAKNP